MILLWGLPGDEPLDSVGAALARRGHAFALLDQRAALNQRVELAFDGRLGGSLYSDRSRIALDDIRALYTRVYDPQQIAHIAAAETGDQRRVQELHAALWAWADDTDARVVNRPSAMATNGSKPYQGMVIERHGFSIPETLITTDAEAASAFWERHGRIIYKSVSGVRSVVSRMQARDRERLPDVAWCPTQFQQWIPGRDYRVHVVGSCVFGVEIVSDADDYRYARAQGLSVELRPYDLPAPVAEAACRLSAALDLSLAGLDLRRTPDGEWYCFEVNSSPCFTYYENHTGQPLSAAVAEWLAAATSTVSIRRERTAHAPAG